MTLPPLTDAEFMRLVLFVRQRCGIDLEKKRALVEARLCFDIAQRGFRSFGAYLAAVTADPDGAECRHMLNRLSTNHTYFFRERAPLEFVSRTLLPEFTAAGGKRLSLWCTACASGEEPYTLAMLLERTPQVRLGLVDYHIRAGDINTELLEQAASGMYPLRQLESIPAEYRGYVSVRGKDIQMSHELMQHITWVYENLMEPPCAGPWDVIFCRNAMIYFKPQEREALAARLHDVLSPGGCLVIGATESVDLKRRLFEHRAPSIYRKRMECK